MLFYKEKTHHSKINWQKRMAESKSNSDVIIEGGTLLTMVDGEEPMHGARVIISGDSIEEVSARQDSPLPEADQIINAEDAIVLPGLINTHGHSPMTIFRGMADDLPLKKWLFDHIFPAEAKHLNPDTVYWASLLGCLEMIASGTTTSVDGYFFADGIVYLIQKRIWMLPRPSWSDG